MILDARKAAVLRSLVNLAWSDTITTNDVARTLKMLRTSKGTYSIKQ